MNAVLLHGAPPALLWTFDPLGTAIAAITGVLYARGLWVLWRRAGAGRGVRVHQAAAFFAGWSALVIALISPLDALSELLFSAHMSQHELLMLVAAPLFVLGRASNVFLWALPRALRERVAGLIQRPAYKDAWRALTTPWLVAVVHALALWIWHVPVLFEAALYDERVHAFQHAAFFVTAALFFWSLIYGRWGRAGYGASVLFVFVTALHSGALGALLSVGRNIVYPTHAARTEAIGADALEDQQLAGLIMWIPAGVVFLVVALALLAAWIGESERRARLGSTGGPR